MKRFAFALLFAATAFAPAIRYCPARGPAPQSTSSLTNFGAESSVGRVARTSLMMKSITKFGTSIFRTSFCQATMRSPVSTLESSGLSPRVESATICRSSSIAG